MRWRLASLVGAVVRVAAIGTLATVCVAAHAAETGMES